LQISNHRDTIVALSTSAGSGAIAVIRLNGSSALDILSCIFQSPKDGVIYKANRIYFGRIMKNNEVVDEVVMSSYHAPKSYTGEDMVEICCHGSNYIIQEIMSLCIANGARQATAGEFTQRAYLNGKLDLSQAESVADLIASENNAQHKMAMGMMRGGFSIELKNMRDALINFAALLELELDFSEEDVVFANREEFRTLLHDIEKRVCILKDSFAYGNAIKKGIPVAIVGKPNSGKSTLLNTFLNEDKAIVSEIAGTTRDVIEDIIHINGMPFRLIDTAGLRETTDTIEQFGIAKTRQKTKEASIVLLLVDIAEHIEDIIEQYNNLNLDAHQQGIIVINKIDTGSLSVCDAYDVEEAIATKTKLPVLAISAKQNLHIDKLGKLINELHQKNNAPTGNIVISNIRHYEALKNILIVIDRIKENMLANISSEFVAMDVRECLRYIGNITGEIEIDRDILGTIFGKFCIGK
jgi:tRNA modification GTPase